MMLIEMREAAKDKAFNLIDEIKDLGKQKKMAICELEDTLYECFESSGEDGQYEDTEKYDPSDYESMYGMRRRSGMRYNRHYAMRDDMDDDSMNDDMNMRNMRSYGRRNMRMRRNRLGRFV